MRAAFKYLIPLLWIVGVCNHLIGQEPPYVQVTRLTVTPQGVLGKFWEARKPKLEDEINRTFATIEIENTSGTEITHSVFYGEYFDAAGRLCFTLLFAQEENLERRTTSFMPNEVRTLYSDATYLSPAIEPKELKLYLIRQEPIIPSKELTEHPTKVSAPSTFASIGLNQDGRRIWLESELTRSGGPILDLALALVSLDSSRKPRKITILNTTNEAVESWFQKFLLHLYYKPASTDGVAAPSSVLVFARAITSSKGLRDAPYLPRDSLWLKRYVMSLSGSQVPPVSTVLLEPVSYDPSRSAISGFFECNIVETSWSFPVLENNPMKDK